jgi:hypothetical protein
MRDSLLDTAQGGKSWEKADASDGRRASAPSTDLELRLGQTALRANARSWA